MKLGRCKCEINQLLDPLLFFFFFFPVQSLFRNITSLHSQLLNYIKVQDDRRGTYEILKSRSRSDHRSNQRHELFMIFIFFFKHTTKRCKKSWLKSMMLGMHLMTYGKTTLRNNGRLLKRLRESGKSNDKLNSRIWGNRSTFCSSSNRKWLYEKSKKRKGKCSWESISSEWALMQDIQFLDKVKVNNFFSGQFPIQCSWGF